MCKRGREMARFKECGGSRETRGERDCGHNATRSGVPRGARRLSVLLTSTIVPDVYPLHPSFVYSSDFVPRIGH